MDSIKHQLLGFFSDIGKSAEDIDYYRISPTLNNHLSKVSLTIYLNH